MIDLYKELLDLISHLEQVTSKQNETIARIVNENAEQENMINVMMQEHVD